MNITREQATQVLTIVQRIAKARYELDTAANELENELDCQFAITQGSEFLDGENPDTITVEDVAEWVAILEEEN